VCWLNVRGNAEYFGQEDLRGRLSLTRASVHAVPIGLMLSLTHLPGCSIIARAPALLTDTAPSVKACFSELFPKSFLAACMSDGREPRNRPNSHPDICSAPSPAPKPRFKAIWSPRSISQFVLMSSSLFPGILRCLSTSK
jgi:hypothetical protein